MGCSMYLRTLKYGDEEEEGTSEGRGGDQGTLFHVRPTVRRAACPVLSLCLGGEGGGGGGEVGKKKRYLPTSLFHPYLPDGVRVSSK